MGKGWVTKQALESGGCQASTTDVYSVKKYKPCGKTPVMFKVTLYRSSLVPYLPHTRMCEECADRTKEKWPKAVLVPITR